MESRFFIKGYGIYSSLGNSFSEFSNAIFSGKTGAAIVDSSCWPEKAQKYWQDQDSIPRACLILDDNQLSSKQKLVSRLSRAFNQLETLDQLRDSKSLGIIFASTKGSIEDYAWKEIDPLHFCDPLAIVLNEFIEQNNLTNIKSSICISNACASSHAAIYQAKCWLDSKEFEDVIVVAADEVGPFIMSGFKSLRALSVNESRPFSADRDGLILGEAACALHLSSKLSDLVKFEISGVDIQNEAHAVTSPSNEGRGIFRCIQNVLATGERPDLIIAHGTGTKLNDDVEDTVFEKVLREYQLDALVTGSKWSVGHTLGASGLVDTIGSVACMNENRAYGITSLLDSSHLGGNYYLSETQKMDISSVMITSLGFGGTNAALIIKRI